MPENNETPETTGDGGHLPNHLSEPADGGRFDPGSDGEDSDIIGKDQADLTADDLKGDSRSE